MLWRGTGAHAVGEGAGWLQFDRLHGDIGFNYRGTSRTTRQGSEEEESASAFTQETLNLRERITVYHPRFLQLNLGGGLALGQGHKDADSQELTLTRYNLAADFLQYHPYSLHLSTLKQEVEQVQSPTAVSVNEQRQNLARLTLKEPLGLPMPLTLSAQETTTDGDAVYQTTDAGGVTDRFRRISRATETYEIASRKRWSRVGLNWRYFTRDVEQTQATELGRSAFEYSRRDFHADADGTAGDNERLRWSLRGNRRSQSDLPRFDVRDASGTVRFKLVDNFYTTLDSHLALAASERVQYPAGAASEESTRTESARVAGGLNHRLFQSLYTNVQASRQRTTHPEFENVTDTRTVGTRYTKRIPDGRITVAYAMSWLESENSGEETVTVVDDSYVLADFVAVQIREENILLDPPQDFVVTDVTGTIVYTAERDATPTDPADYRVFQTGTLTFIERVPGTSILNGETVLIDYAFLTPRRTKEARTRSYSLGTRWRFVDAYYRVADREESVVEGQADPTLNPGRQTIYGVELSHRFPRGITPEASVEREVNTQRRDPFDRLSRAASLGVLITAGLDSVVFINRTSVDHEGAGRDTDKQVLGTNFSYRYGRYAGTLRASEESSRIGDSLREALVAEATLEVRYGQWVLDTRVRGANESFRASGTAPEFEATSMSYFAGLKRTF